MKNGRTPSPTSGATTGSRPSTTSSVAPQVPREPGNQVVAAELASVTEEKGGKLMGVDKATGKPSTWLVQDSDRRCRGCS